MLKPLGDRVVIEAVKVVEKTKSGIVLPDSAKDKPNEGAVVAVGPGKKTDEGKVIPLDVKVGDTVIYSSYSGTTVKVDEDEYLIVSESDVLAVK
jgi:chaperonin GroES